MMKSIFKMTFSHSLATKKSFCAKVLFCLYIFILKYLVACVGRCSGHYLQRSYRNGKTPELPMEHDLEYIHVQYQ